ncbi:membrane protease YdiL (CAAX protease family) [Kineococcus xinjiangensis]|uniref:Membrane protease YdiL (CAAX protease family) n=1 Tax=Kineococcus xinjiangensis TaxID=512762 RepID=A0A2S6IEV6_9ACTN|nr:CPBP family intramembrane glutamic endopeptidase [Kineococcus xinjiangensis]PPK92690.1 membrane protease YdiL (CAAX protease family) [Kineococcus xinjiangensis]
MSGEHPPGSATSGGHRLPGHRHDVRTSGGAVVPGTRVSVEWLDADSILASPAAAAGVARERRGELPYHLLARRGRTQWWRPLAEIAVFLPLAGIATVVAVAVTLLLSWAAGSPADLMDAGGSFWPDAPLWSVVMGLGSVAIVLPVVWFTVRVIARRPFGTVSSVTGALRWRWLLACLPLGLVMAVGNTFLAGALLTAMGEVDPASAHEGASSFGSSLWPGWSTFLVFTAVVLVLVPLQAATEEYVCRGWLLQTLVTWVGNRWVAAGITSLLFMSLHGRFDLVSVVYFTFFALLACWVTFRTGGLEAAIAMHVSANVFYLLIAGTQGIPDMLTEASVPVHLTTVITSVALGVAYAASVVWLFRRRAMQASGVPA